MRLRKRSATDILHKVTPTTSVARGEMQVSLTAITEALNAVFERYGDKIIFAYLFGSTVKGEIAPLSDVDVAVYLSDNLIVQAWRSGNLSYAG